MTVKEAAKKWKLCEKTIYNYCKCSKIPCHKEKGIWIIEDNQEKPLIIKKKEFTQIEVEYYILKAINENKYLNYNTFSYSNERFASIINDLLNQCCIEKINDLNVIPNSYLLTNKGVEIVQEKLHNAIKLIAEVLGTYTGVFYKVAS